MANPVASVSGFQDDESFLSDLKTTVSKTASSLLGTWLDSFKDPLERAKALLSRCRRASLLFRAGDSRGYVEERDELRKLIIKEINSIPIGATDVSSSNQLQILDSALDVLNKAGYRFGDISEWERERWMELATRFVWAVEKLAEKK